MSKSNPETHQNHYGKPPLASGNDLAISTTAASNPHNRLNWIDAHNVGLLLKHIRQYQTRSQLDISTSANINSTYYCHLEAGKSRVSLYKLCEILNAMKIPAWHFIRWLEEGWTALSLNSDLQRLAAASGRKENTYQPPGSCQEVAEPNSVFKASPPQAVES
ncbi:helix-turn-helix transcriptional regulator [Oscillospiraceae bacterium HV4-5-C5C]|nr:helix-turn-helix transcriptional regulator [Oscillospiraceae bacterium HV4-5-C5C]